MSLDPGLSVFESSSPNDNRTLEENQLTVHTEEPDFLNAILTSSCLAPSKLSFNPFAETQFGLEAN